LDVRVDATCSTLPADLTADLRAIATELLENVRRHAHATSASVELARSGDQLRLRVRDDGTGLASPTLPGDRGRGQPYGLLGVRGRAAARGRTVDIDGETGHGTTVDVLLPAVRASAA